MDVQNDVSYECDAHGESACEYEASPLFDCDLDKVSWISFDPPPYTFARCHFLSFLAADPYLHDDGCDYACWHDDVAWLWLLALTLKWDAPSTTGCLFQRPLPVWVNLTTSMFHWSSRMIRCHLCKICRIFAYSATLAASVFNYGCWSFALSAPIYLELRRLRLLSSILSSFLSY